MDELEARGGAAGCTGGGRAGAGVRAGGAGTHALRSTLPASMMATLYGRRAGCTGSALLAGGGWGAGTYVARVEVCDDGDSVWADVRRATVRRGGILTILTSGRVRCRTMVGRAPRSGDLAGCRLQGLRCVKARWG